MKLSLSQTELQAQLASVGFTLKTQQQIAKDFGVSAVFFPESFESNALGFEDMVTLVGEKLSEIMTLGERETLQLLYQIDIPQETFLSLTTDPDFIAKMSDLIIRREAYKVHLRNVYSAKS